MVEFISLIKIKIKLKKNRPREAASAIVKLVNSKNLNQAMLALTVSNHFNLKTS